MKLNFTLTKEDIYAWNAQYLKHHAPFWHKYLTWIVGGAVLMFLFTSGTLRELYMTNLPIVSLGWTVLFIGLFVFFYLRFRRNGPQKMAIDRMIKNNPHMIGEKEVELFDDRISYREAHASADYQISALFGWDSSPTHEFILISKQMALIIPRDAFGDGFEYQDFLDWAETHLRGEKKVSH